MRRFRVAIPVGLGLLAFLAISLGPPWFGVLLPGPLRRRLILRLLLAVRATQDFLWLILPVALLVLAIVLRLGRGRGARRLLTARLFVLCLALAFSLAMAEGIAALWMARKPSRPPRLAGRSSGSPAGIGRGKDARIGGDAAKPAPARSADDSDPDDVNIVIMGESSACGYPYDQWFSVARIVGWKLGEAIPQARIHVEYAARPGIRLDMAQEMLPDLERRPDLVIVYAGHNEFSARYHWERAPRYYVDDPPPRRPERDGPVRAGTPLSRLLDQTIANYRISVPPPPDAARPLVDVPVYTAAEYDERLRDFHDRLEAITTELDRLGALVVLVPPPSNEADFEPNRSFLSPGTPRAERDRFARAFDAVRRVEGTDPAVGIAAYRDLLARQPVFAEAHYRLARLLEADGARDEANAHYIAARDLDGFPVRCVSDHLSAYREVAAHHPSAILVDAPEVLREATPRGIVGDEVFADAHHPSIVGYAAISQAILGELRRRGAFGWPESSPEVLVSAADCAAHFGMDAQGWEDVCNTIAAFYGYLAPVRYDGRRRSARADRYSEAIALIEGGSDLESLHLPGIGYGGPAADHHSMANGQHAE